MSWARKDEGARLYKEHGNYMLIFALKEDHVPPYGFICDARADSFATDMLRAVEPYDPDQWTVKRNDGFIFHICYRGYRQEWLHSLGTMLCLPTGAIAAHKATDEQILEAVLGDEPIFGEIPSRLKRGDAFTYYRSTPITFGGSAKRIAWNDLPADIQELFTPALKGKDPREFRGLWRMKDLNDNFAKLDKQQKLNLDVIPSQQARAAGRISQCGGLYCYESNDTPESLAVDLLADLRHYCNEHKLSFDDLADRAYRNYLDEGAE